MKIDVNGECAEAITIACLKYHRKMIKKAVKSCDVTVGYGAENKQHYEHLKAALDVVLDYYGVNL